MSGAKLNSHVLEESSNSSSIVSHVCKDQIIKNRTHDACGKGLRHFNILKRKCLFGFPNYSFDYYFLYFICCYGYSSRKISLVPCMTSRCFQRFVSFSKSRSYNKHTCRKGRPELRTEGSCRFGNLPDFDMCSLI